MSSSGGEGSGELLFDRYKVLVGEDDKVLEMDEVYTWWKGCILCVFYHKVHWHGRLGSFLEHHFNLDSDIDCLCSKK